MLRNLKKRKLQSGLRYLRAPDDSQPPVVAHELFEAAKRYLEQEKLTRYLSKKYTMPMTDPRLQAYLPEEMLLEFVADAIEDDHIELDVDGKPVRYVKHQGVEIVETGDSVFDALEREWAEQDPEMLRQVARARVGADELPDDIDLLQELERKIEDGERPDFEPGI